MSMTQLFCSSNKYITPVSWCCSQVSNSNCDQGFKPATRQACNRTPCAVADPGLVLGFTAWGECNVQCGSGYSARTAYCTNAYGSLADLSMCGNYTGKSATSHLQLTCSMSSRVLVTSWTCMLVRAVCFAKRQALCTKVSTSKQRCCTKVAYHLHGLTAMSLAAQPSMTQSKQKQFDGQVHGS